MEELKWDQTFDVVIIGGGTAGLAAAIQSKKMGDNVVILEKEKEGVFRSSLSVIAGIMAFSGTKYQKEKGIEDSPALFAKDGVEYCGGDPSLWKNMADNLYKTLELIENELKLIPNDVIGGVSHERIPLMGLKFFGDLKREQLSLER
jgi:fumarate reductase flavoprotein subunit